MPKSPGYHEVTARWVQLILRNYARSQQIRLVEQRISAASGVTMTLHMQLSGGWLMNKWQARTMAVHGGEEAANI